MYLVVDGVRPTQKQVCHLEQPFFYSKMNNYHDLLLQCGSITPQLSGEKLKIWVTYKTSTVAGELTMPQKHHISKWNPGLDEIGNELPVTQVGWEESLNTKCHFRVMYVFFFTPMGYQTRESLWFASHLKSTNQCFFQANIQSSFK